MGLLDDELLQSRIGATPRNPILGLLSDFLAKSYSPERTQQMQGISKLFMAPEISQTLDRLSYDPSGRSLFTGAGGLGGTTRMRPEALDAVLAVAPMAGPAARLAGRGAMAVGRAGERYAEKVVPQIMERGGLGAEMLQGMSNRTVSPLDVYHGTPHRFQPTANNPLGEFDASKIGTGEGAQVYGHGLYFAENPAVAKEYQNQLGTQMKYKGREFYDPIVGKKTGTTGNTEIDDYLLSYLGDTGVIRKELLNAAKDMRASNNPQALKDYQTLMSDFRKIRGDVTAANTGSLYKVNLPDEQIAQMLDFDKPINQQSSKIQAIAKKFEYPLDRTGGDFQRWLSSPNGGLSINLRGPKDQIGLEKQATEILQKSGIPGIKYLDQQSRNAGGWHLTSPDNTVRGKWMLKSSDYNSNGVFFNSKKEAEAALKEKLGKETRNFVTFPGEEENLRILYRNGLLN